MFKKVIAGDDGRAGGADAVALARALAPGAELILATAYPWDTPPSRFLQPGYGNDLRDDATRALERRRDEAGVPDARIAAIADTSPARALHDLAEIEHADLVVLGTAHHGALGRMLLGDVGRDVLHGSPCPVAVAPQGFAEGGTGAAARAIGVAFDHSPEATRALEVAVGLARELGARVALREVVAADILPAIGGYPMVNVDALTEELRADAQTRLDAVAAGLGDDVTVTAQAVSGHTADCLEELAGQVDLLVCGSRGWGALRSVVLGSTADRLIHRATCPVLVVPRGAETPKKVFQKAKVEECPPPARSLSTG
ncbi:MAG TPA: universal stress protein [Baekduia sp.]|nr:universal stress protein [Baekduia sp.]